MFRIISSKGYNDNIKRSYHEGYDKGVSVGYNLGYLLGQIEARNKSFCGIEFTKRSKMESEIEDIINKEF